MEITKEIKNFNADTGFIRKWFKNPYILVCLLALILIALASQISIEHEIQQKQVVDIWVIAIQQFIWLQQAALVLLGLAIPFYTFSPFVSASFDRKTCNRKLLQCCLCALLLMPSINLQVIKDGGKIFSERVSIIIGAILLTEKLASGGISKC